MSIRRKTSSREGLSAKFDPTDEEIMALYTAVGAVIVNWGVVESAVSQACHILLAMGGHKSQRLAPVEFQRRLKFIKACFKYPELAHMRDYCSSLRGETKELSKHRDFMVHGVVTSFDRANQTVWFARLDPRKHEYEQFSSPITVQELLEIHAAAQQIGADWLKLVEGLHGVWDRVDRFKDADRIRHVPVRKWAYRVYQGIQRLIGFGK